METWKPKIFHNDTLDTSGNDGSELAYDVGMRTSPAPTYFPTYGKYIDGGVVANNPSMVAIAQALVASADHPERSLNNIVLLSLGTGFRESMVKGDDHNWGGAEWLSAGIIDLLLDGSMDIARYECEQLLGKKFCRLSPLLDGHMPLDDVTPEILDELVNIADALDLAKVIAWIREYWL